MFHLAAYEEAEHGHGGDDEALEDDVKPSPPLKMLSFRSRGGRRMTSFSASSMPRAMAGKVSVIRLIPPGA